jgi:hypothetical protein
MSASLINAEATYSIPPKIVATWAITDTTGLVEIKLPGLANDEPSYRQVPNLRMVGGKSYAIQLLGFSISCSSVNFNVKILDINDVTKLDTIFEVLSYNNINLDHSDESFENFVIKNRDNPETNSLYVYLENASGTTLLSLTYVTLQDRPF